MKSLITLLLLCLAGTSFALSTESKKAGEQLVAQLNADIKELAVHPDDNRIEIANVRQYLRQIENSLVRKNIRIGHPEE